MSEPKFRYLYIALDANDEFLGLGGTNDFSLIQEFILSNQDTDTAIYDCVEGKHLTGEKYFTIYPIDNLTFRDFYESSEHNEEG